MADTKPPEQLSTIELGDMIAEIGRIDCTYPHRTNGTVIGAMCRELGMDYQTFRTRVFEEYGRRND